MKRRVFGTCRRPAFSLVWSLRSYRMIDQTGVDRETLERVVLQMEVEQFLYKEARLLDERRLKEWLELLADELDYWMPMRRNIKFGDWDMEFTKHDTEINWFDEGK